MNSESIPAGAAIPKSIARLQNGLRLTPAERKYLLLLVDLILVNASLLLAVIIWNGFEPSLQAVLVFARWFLILSVVWVVTATVCSSLSGLRSRDSREFEDGAFRPSRVHGGCTHRRPLRPQKCPW